MHTQSLRISMLFVFAVAIRTAVADDSAKKNIESFRAHEIGRPGGKNFGQTSAVDVDHDGDGDIDIFTKPWGGDLHLLVENQLLTRSESE